MTVYAETRNGEYCPALLVSCSISSCVTQMVVPKDIPPRQFGERLGWTFVEHGLGGKNNGIPSVGFICHLHVIHPRLEIDETN